MSSQTRSESSLFTEQLNGESLAVDLATLPPAVGEVLLLNFERGRIERFLEGSAAGLDDYVARVVENVGRFAAYVRALQVEQDEAAWTELLEKLERWALGLFGRWGSFLPHERPAEARDCAVEAAAQLLEAPYPYDVAFDAWAFAIARNVCRRRVRRAMSAARVAEREHVELDALEHGAETLGAVDGRLRRIAEEETRQQLEAAVAQLSPARRTFIVLYYYEALAFEEIGRLMEKRASALYSLHFRALEQLRQLLPQDV